MSEREIITLNKWHHVVLDEIKIKKVGDSFVPAFFLTPGTMEMCDLT